MRTLGAVAAVLLGAEWSEAGPWAMGRGQWYFNLTYENLETTELATPAGNVEEIPEFVLRQVGVYAAYGLTDSLTAVVDRLGFRFASLEDFDSASGIEDLRLGLQVQLAKKGAWVLATRGILQAPIGDETKGLGLLPTGSGAWESDLRFSFGRSSTGGRIYGYAELGHQIRGRGLRDGFLYEGQLGVWATGKVLLMFNVRGVQPYRTQPGEASLANVSGLGDGVTYTVAGPSAIFDIGRGWGIQLEAENAWHERNLATGVKLRIKLFFQP